MKKLLIAAAVIFAAASCGKKTEKMTSTDNSLTAEEIALGIMTPEVMWKLGRVGEFNITPDGRNVLYSLTQYSMADNKGQTDLWIVPVDGGKTTRISDGNGNSSNPVWLDKERLLFLSDRSGTPQIWCTGRDARALRQITDYEEGIEGFGISPNGNKIFIVKRTKVDKIASADLNEDLPLSKARIYDDLMVRHWDHWNDGTFSHIFIADFDGQRVGELTDILEGEPWDAPMSPYFDNEEIAWNNAGTQLAYTCKKLTGTAYALSTDSDIYLYDVAAKTTENLTEGMVGYDKYPRFSPDDALIAFTSMERAGNESDKDRLFVMNADGSDKRYLTHDFDYNASNLMWEGNGKILFLSPIHATQQLCVADLDGTVEVLTEGDHDIVNFDKRGDALIIAKQSVSSPTELFNGDTMLTGSHNKQFYDNIRMGDVEKRMVRTTDGKDMLTWVVFPPDFDPAKQYPTLLYCQGGPQSVVSQFWSYRWNLQLMAAQGYIVVAPNRRGLPSFGQEWLDQISGDYSGQNIRDYLSAIDDVAREAWVDADRLGAVGASYGGYSVFYLAGHHDKRFKALIAHCGIFNFESMYGETEELFFINNDYGGPYWDKSNPTAQRSYANSPHKSVANWDTPILIVTGEKDYRIPYTQSLEAFTAARVQGVPSRLVSFENEAHQVFKPQNSILWNREFFGWLDKYLK